jgi:uncharacterized membrane protein
MQAVIHWNESIHACLDVNCLPKLVQLNADRSLQRFKPDVLEKHAHASDHRLVAFASATAASACICGAAAHPAGPSALGALFSSSG